VYLALLAALLWATASRVQLLDAPRRPDDWPIRRHPAIAHLMPYLRGDSLAAIWFAARVLRRKFIDQNAQADRAGLVWIMHWANLWKGGWRWEWTGEHDAKGREIRRLIPKHRRSEQINDLSSEQVARRRTARRGGRRPHTAEASMERCAKYRLTLCLEGKGTCVGARALTYVADAAKRTGCAVVFMTLQSIAGWRVRLRDALAVDLPCALLPRGPKPDDWEIWAARGVQVWGRWR